MSFFEFFGGLVFIAGKFVLGVSFLILVLLNVLDHINAQNPFRISMLLLDKRPTFVKISEFFKSANSKLICNLAYTKTEPVPDEQMQVHTYCELFLGQCGGYF